MKPPMISIGVMGGASSNVSPEFLSKAAALGEAIAANGCAVITGACPGLPLAAADAARRRGARVVGISPATNLREHIQVYGSPAEGHDVLVFTGYGFMGREVINIRTSDIIVIIGGRTGTLGELAIAYDEGKLIGVLTGTGGITEVIPAIMAVCDNKNTGAKVLYHSDPEILIKQLLAEYTLTHSSDRACVGDPLLNVGIRTERDHVCGMWLNPQNAAAVRSYNGRQFYFCCADCAGVFDADTERYSSTKMFG